MSKNLELAQTEELLEELGNRYDHVIFMGVANRTKTEIGVGRRWSGDVHVCIGLAYDIAHHIMTDYRPREEPL